MTTVKTILALILMAGAVRAAPFRTFSVTTEVNAASVPAVTPLRWFQGESLGFTHVSSAANWTGRSNLVAVWSLQADQGLAPADSNAYLWVTGSVVAASGTVSFVAAPEETAMPVSNYWAYVTLYQTDAAGLTNEEVGVLYRGKAQVQYRATSAQYVGPWQIPTNMVDSYARSIAVAASNLASTALQPSATNNFLAAMPSLQDVITTSGIASNETIALIDYVNGRSLGINRTHPNITGAGIYGQYTLGFRLGMADSDGRTLLDVSTSNLGPGSGVGSDTDVLYGNGQGWKPVNDLSAVKTNAPVWLAQTNYTAAITLTNDLERPQYLYATGAVSLAFAGLRQPQPIYLIVKGPSTLTFPSGTHFVGGASWQTNQANHFLVWQYGTNLFCNPITTSED
jgi:hypothetical protein